MVQRFLKRWHRWGNAVTENKVRSLDEFRRAKAGKSSSDAVRALQNAVENALKEIDGEPPAKRSVRKRANRATQTILGDNNMQIAQRLAASQSITGNGNYQVSSVANIHIHPPHRPKRTRSPTPVPGDGQITNQQAAELKRLVGVVVALSDNSWSFVYGKLNERFETRSYTMIERHRYDEAATYLRKWVASVSAPPPLESIEEQRKRLLKRIHAQARKQGGCLDRIRTYLVGRVGTESLAGLTPGQLQEVIKKFRL